MANDTVISIKGEISDLQQKLKVTKQGVTETFDSWQKSVTEVRLAEQELIKVKQDQASKLQSSKDIITSLNNLQANGVTLTKQQKIQLSALTKEVFLAEKAHKALNKELLANISSAKKQASLQRTELTNVRALTAEYKKEIQARRQHVSEVNNETSSKNKNTVASKDNSKSLKVEDAERRSAGNTLVRHIRRLESMAVAYYAVSRAYTATFGAGVELNRQYENMELGLTALLSSKTTAIKLNGEEASSLEKFNFAQQQTGDVLENIKKGALNTPATFQQMAGFYQQAIGHAMAAGDAFGESLDEISNNTITLTQRMSNLGSSMGMSMELINEEIRSLMSGNVTSDSTLSLILFGNATKANAAVKEAKKRVNGLTDLFEGLLTPFKDLEGVMTFDKQLSHLVAQIDDIRRGSAEPIFEDIKESMAELTKYLKDHGEEIEDSVIAAYDGLSVTLTTTMSLLRELKEPFDGVTEGVGSLQDATVTTAMAFSLMIEGFKNGIAVLKNLAQAAPQFGASLAGLVMDKYDPLIDALHTVGALSHDNYVTYGELKKKTKDIANDTTQLDSLIKETKTWEQMQDAVVATGVKMQNLFEIKRELRKDDLYGGFGVTKGMGSEDAADVFIALEKQHDALLEKYKGNEAAMYEVTSKYTKIREALSSSYLANEVAHLSQKKEAVAEASKEELAWLKEKQKLLNDIQNGYLDKHGTKAVDLFQESEGLVDKYRGQKGATLLIDEWYTEKLTEISKEAEAEVAKDRHDSVQAQLVNLEKISKLRQEDAEKRLKYEQDFADTLDENYLAILEAQNDIANSTQDWASGLTGVANQIMAVSNAMTKMQVDERVASTAKFELDKKFAEDAAKFTDIESLTKLKQQHIKSTSLLEEKANSKEIDGLANLAGAMNKTFEEGSEAAKAFSALQQVLAIANLAQSTAFTSLFVTQEAVKTQAAGTTAVAIAAQSSPWTGLATAAAMVAMLASLGVTLGVSIGSGTTNTYDTHSAQAANVGTETDALKNSLDILSDLAKPEFRLLSQMNKSLLSIDYALSGTATNLSRTGGFAMGEGYNNTLSSTNQNVNTTASAAILGGPIGIGTLAVSELTKKIFGDNPISNIIDSVIGSFGSFIGGIGGSTTSKSITDAGITFGNQLLTDALDDLIGSSYQTIKTRKVTSGFFSSSTKNSYNTTYDPLAEETDNEFELILNSLYDTVVMAGEGLNIATSAIDEELADFYVNLGKISLKGKSDEQIQKLLTDIFGEISDNMAIDAIPLIEGFKNIGEGYFETLVRVSSGVQEAEYYINRLGGAFEEIAYTDILNKQGDVGFEALSQSIIKADEAVYGMNNGVVQMISSMNVATDELYDTYVMFEQVRLQLDATGQSASNLTSEMLLGAGGVDELADGLSSYIENYLTKEEQFAYNSGVLAKEFEKINLAMPTSIDGFRELTESIDTSSVSGQELFGRLITLSDEFSDVFADLTDSLSVNIEEMKKQLSDAWLSEYSPLSMLQKTEYANNLAFNPDSSGLTAIDASYLALQTAAKTATRDEELALAFSNYTALLEEQIADASRQDIVDVLEKVSNTLNDIVDRVERLEQTA